MNNQARVCKLKCKYNVQNICSIYGDCIAKDLIEEKWYKLFNHLNDWALAIAPDERTDPKEKERKQIVYDTLQTILNIMINEEDKE